ncbi:MAG: glycoside hydrolase family 18 [Alistipes communis]
MGRYEGGIFRYGARGDFTEDKFAEYCKIETEKQLAACSRYGFDGIVVSYLGGYDSSVAAPFVLAADTWRRDNPDKLLFFRGYPAFITSIENQTILSECDYVIIRPRVPRRRWLSPVWCAISSKRAFRVTGSC